ncbi:MAG TPA: hypothetical protein VMV86_04960 [Methanosarcinales archaeon]|nr:hypothetical protein [Methanosarcinales archaeon]
MAVSLGRTLVSPILSANLLAEAIPICDTTNNTPSALAQRQFVYTWGIKVTPYSERIILNFVNVGQTTTVKAALGLS